MPFSESGSPYREAKPSSTSPGLRHESARVLNTHNPNREMQGETTMKHQSPRAAMRALTAAAGVAAAVCASSATALEFDLGDLTTVKLDSLFTIGTVIRAQDRDPSLVGKSNLNPGVCVARDGDDGVSGANPDRDQNSYTGNTCNPGQDDDSGQGFANANAYFVAQPGSFSPNGDNGNLNFNKGDIVHATAKITSDLSFNLYDFNVFVRGLALFDDKYSDFEQTHPDTTFQPRHDGFSKAGEDRLGMDVRLLDYFVSRTFEFADRQINIKVGNQVLNWGESSFLLANSLNSINPPDQARLRVPGFDIKELSQPQGMLVINAELFSGINLETFYQYEWQPVIADPVGSFFSQSDLLGEGAAYAMLSFSKAPEDPLALYAPRYNPDSPVAALGQGDPAYLLNSHSSRTIFIDKAASENGKPSDGGQYGASLKFFLEDFNGGTEVGLYFANYHARVPSISGFAADATCLPDSVPTGVGLALALEACGFPGLSGNDLTVLGQLVTTGVLDLGKPQVALPEEALPLDTARVFVEYPENIRMYGVSFNTTLGDWALSGEYVWRENLPIQIHSTDLLFALLQPAFPAEDLNLTVATLPGRRSAVPDFIQTNYRGVQTNPGDYVRGWEPMGIGQANLTLLKTFGGDNFLKASQISLLIEMGYTHIPDLPGLDELQTNGAGTDTHISAGADGSIGINPMDVRSDPNNPFSDSRTTLTSLQNPTSWYGVDVNGFGTEQSYGYRLVTLTRYDNALFGSNIEFLNALFHDIKGTGPGLGQNFVEGRMQAISGVRFDYLSTFIGELRYTWFFSGGKRDQLRDRDNLLLSLGYQF